MKITGLDRALVDLRGRELIAEGEPLTFRGAVAGALLSQPSGENLSGAKKYRRYRLARLVMDAQGEVELTAEDVAEIKQAVGEVYLPLVVGQVWDWLEGA